MHCETIEQSIIINHTSKPPTYPPLQPIPRLQSRSWLQRSSPTIDRELFPFTNASNCPMGTATALKVETTAVRKVETAAAAYKARHRAAALKVEQLAALNER
jgi:hypothetical protein